MRSVSPRRSVPGVISVFAGIFSQFDMWFCGCDACDETWQEVADSLEDVLLRLARGGVSESLGRGRSGRAQWSLGRPGGVWSGTMPLRGVPRRQRHEWAGQLEQLPEGRWSGWARRLDAPDHDSGGRATKRQDASSR